MKKHVNLLALSAVLIPAQFSCSSISNKQENPTGDLERPNIIIILADDMGYSDLGCYGSEIPTPNIDKLAAEGILFTQFYNAARCCPTRAALLTGLYPHQAGMGAMVNTQAEKPKGAYQGYLSDNSVTIAEVLKLGNYYTAASGKWHVGEERPYWPTDRGFDNYYGLISGAANYFDITKAKAPGVKRHFAIDSTEFLPDKETFYMTDAITENAVKFLQKAETKDQPFFLYLPYTAPHWPLHARQEDIEKYKGKYMKGWDVLRKERYERMLGLGIIDDSWPLSDRDPKIMPWEDLSEEQKAKSDLLMAIYAAQIDRLDSGIGEVLAQLDAMGKSENTLIIFLSDNGGCEEYEILGSDFWGNFWDGTAVPGSGESFHSYGAAWANLSDTPFRLYKKRIHEGGISTPLIVRWPDKIKSKGSINNQPGHIIDIMATICDITNIDYPETYNNNNIKPLAGKSLLPLLEGEENIDNDLFFWEHIGNRAVRHGDWKLVAKSKEAWELYNIKLDRTEMNNLIGSEPEIAGKLEAEYNAWAEENGVK
ncbi:MAG: arylsulfatase [Bacteroidales bacterium]|nr:arylsulfatase [Bacteroidales bacterium]MCF8390095.1 arylsulfatase [Bacteroidales bacterium]